MITIPTVITALRIGLVGPLVVFFFINNYTLYWICFLLAFGSDWLDGYLARKLKQETHLGALLDPIADKILVVSLSAAFWYSGNALVPGWFFMVLFSKESLLLMGAFLANIFVPGKKIQAHLPGKIAFVAQAELLARASLGWTFGIVIGTNIGATICMIYALGYYIWNYHYA